eukprot:Skav209292  [mRNA]  locus=scaffold251:156758:157084:+ [translate_table: standard]
MPVTHEVGQVWDKSGTSLGQVWDKHGPEPIRARRAATRRDAPRSSRAPAVHCPYWAVLLVFLSRSSQRFPRLSPFEHGAAPRRSAATAGGASAPRRCLRLLRYCFGLP